MSDNVGIVYDKLTGQIRRHIYFDHDYQIPIHQNAMHTTEAMCFVPMSAHHAGHEVFHQAIKDSVKAHGNVDAKLFQ